MNRRLILSAVFLTFCVLLSGPAIILPSQSGLQDIDPLFAERNWNFADLPEGPIIYDNREDYVDQLSDLHNESDIGTHSSFVSMQALDGVYNTLMSDNITIPEQSIEDPLNVTPSYNQSAYESWRLDLECAWTDVDYGEISSELCIFGGTQAEVALRVDIWDNDGWINVISDVVVGWNNISISPSLVDKSLEMRFTGSDSGNTSVQSSWEIDAVLLHTWTTVYGSELTQSGIIQVLNNNLSRYISSIGEQNTWNELNETWHRYLYDPETKIVKIGNLTISHLPGGALSIDGTQGSHVGKLSWYIQAYYNDIWNNITLDNYNFVGFSKTTDNVTAHQRFWGTQGEMNVYLTYSYVGGFKTRVDIRNDASQAVPIRAIWAARDVSGIQDNYELLYNEDGVLYGIQIEDAAFSWYDVLVSDNPLPTQTVVDKPNRRAAVIFGNQSTVIPSGYTAIIDPSFYVAADADDNYWDIWDAPVRYDSATNNKIQTDDSTYTYVTTFRMALGIVPYSTVTQASLDVYVTAQSGADSVTIERINALSAAVLEGGSYPSIDTSPTGTVLINAIGWETSDEIGDLVQEQINQAGWTGSSQYIGFRLKPTGVCGHTIYDYQSTGQVPTLTVTFETPSANWLAGYAYRQGHSIDGKTGAGTFYQVEIAVEYGAGVSAGGTIYCNSHCDTDFDDIRFTDNDGQTELDYWMEEKTDSDDATFWVEVTDDLGSDQVIYCYYGKSGDSTTSDGDTTFIAFDDFEDNNLDKWEGEDPTYTATQSGTVYAGTYAVFINPPAGASTGMRYNFTEQVGTLDYSVMINYHVRTSTTAKVWYDRMTGSGGTGYDMVLGGVTGYVTYYTTVYTKYPNNIAFSSATWLEINHAILPSGSSTQRVWESGDYCGSINYGPVTNNPDLKYATYSVQKALDGWMDNFYVRKWITTEPAHYTWGREQEAPNNPPTVEPQPTIAVLDDTEKLYSRLRKYEVTTYYKDLDGYADIDHVQFYVYNEAHDFIYFYGRFVQSTHVFSEEGTTTQKSRWGLDTGGSTYSEHNIYYLNVTWKFYIEWVCPDVLNLDVRCYVMDAETESDSLYYDYLWDGSNSRDCEIETDLTYDTIPTVTNDDAAIVDRGDLDELFHITGNVGYEGSTLTPPSGDVDVMVAVTIGGYGTNVGPWEDDVLGATGDLDVTCYADNEVGIETYTIKVVNEGTGYGGTDLVVGTDPTDTYIADRIEVYAQLALDGRVDIDANGRPRFQLRLEYDNHVLNDGTNDDVWIESAVATWDGSRWYKDYSQSTVGLWTYKVTAAYEATYGVSGLDSASATTYDCDIIWDQVEIYSIVAPDDHVGASTGTTLQYYIRYDYLSQAGVTGTFTTDTTADSLVYQSGNQWDATINETLGIYTFNGFTTCSESQYGLTVWTFTGTDESIDFDIVRALAIEVSDDRCNYGSNQWVRVRFDYQSTAYGYVTSWSTTPTITGPNGAITLSTDDGSGWWRGSTGVYSTVARFDYNTNTLNDFIDVDSILSRNKGSFTNYTIWDRVEIYSIVASDSHLGIGYGTTLSYYLKYDYDDLAVNSGGTFTTDETADNLVYQSGNLWQATANEVSVGSIIFNGFTGCSDTGYSLTAWTFTGSQVTVTWDRVRALAILVEDNRGNYGAAYYVQVTFDYESAAYGYVSSWSTTPTITGPLGTVTLSSGQGSGVWRGTSGAVSSVTRHDYNTNTLNDFIDADGVLARTKGTFTDYTIWDRIEVVVAVDMTWTIYDYYINVSYTGTYEYDSTPWSGYATIANTSLTTGGAVHYEELTFSTVVNKTFYATAVEDAGGYGLTVLGSTNTVWCVFDDIVPSGSVAYYWTTPASPNLDSVNLIWGAGSNWKWDYNDTLLNIVVTFTSYSNGSAPSGAGGTYGSGAFGGLTTGLYSGVVWNYVEFSINTTVTITGIDYDWEIWSAGLEVDVPHSLATTAWDLNREGDYYTLLVHTNYENASVMVWDDLEVGAGFNDSIYYGNYEGMHEWMRDTTVGTHNCTILLNAGENKGAVERDYVAGDLRLWYNFTYAIEPAVLAITNPVYTASDAQNFLSGETNVGCDWYAYNNDTEIDTGVLGAGSFAIDWNKNITVGYYVWGVKFDDGSTTRWVNGTFEVSATVLTITNTIYMGSAEYNDLSGQTNAACDYYLYENETQKTNGNLATGSFHIGWDRNATDGLITWGAKFDDGTTVRWVNGSYYNAPTSYDDLMLSAVSFTAGTEEIAVFIQTNWNNCTIHIYDNNSIMTSGAEGSLSYTNPQSIGLHRVGCYVNGTAQNLWVNFTYSVAADADLSITALTFDTSGVNVSIFVNTNWGNTTVTVYEGDVQKDTASEGALTYTKATAAGDYSVGIKIDGGADLIWANFTYTIGAEDSLSITALTFDSSGVNVSIFVNTNWGNCTITVYEDDVQKTTGSEGTLRYVKATAAGDYSVGIKIDGGADLIWANYTYAVSAEDALSITSLSFGTDGADVTAFATTNWLNATLTLYEDDVEKDTGNEGTTLSYTKATAAGDYSIGLKIDGGADSLWANYTYTIEAEDALSITSLSFGTDGAEVTAFATTNWLNTTLTLYENDVEKDTGSEGTTLTYSKATAAGDYNIGLKIDGGAGLIWANYTYSISAEDALSLTSLSFGTAGIEVTAFATTNWLNTTLTLYEDDVQKDTGSEGTTLSYTKATAEGNYSIGLKVDGGAGLIWANYTYSVTAADTLSISNTVYTATDDRNYVSGHANLDCNWYAYNNDTLMDSGALTAGSFQVDWSKNTTVGLYEWGVKFDDGTSTRWVNGSFEVSAIVLAITNTVYIGNAEWNDLSAHTNAACDYYVYENNSQIDTGALGIGSLHIGWARNTTDGLVVWGIKFDDSTTIQWVNGSYYNAPTSYDDLMLSAVSFTAGTEEIAVFIQTNWNNCTIHLYDNDTIKASGNEGSLSYTNPQSIGLHRVGCYVNGTAQNLWVNFTYSVAAEANLSITALNFDTSGVNVSIFVNTNWGNTTVTVYEDDAQEDTGDEGILTYVKATTAGNYSVGIKIDGGTDLIWANFTYTIGAEDTLSITSLTFGVSGADVTAFATTNWLNATLTLYEDDVEKDTGNEGTTLSYTKATTAGDYSIGLKINGSADIIWANYTYTVSAEDSLSITALTFDSSGVNVSIFVNTNWGNTTITVYEDDVQETTGSEGTLRYVKSTAAGDYSVGIKIDGGTDLIWANFTYTIGAEDTLSITSLTFGVSGADVTAFATTNWLNATLTLYEDDVEKDTGDEGTTLSYTKATAAGDYNIGLKIDGGADFIWANYTYTVSAEDSLSITALTFDSSGVNVSIFVNTNWGNATITVYEDDVQETTGSEGTLRYVKSTAAGDYSVGIKIDGGTDLIWANYTYSITAEDTLSITALTVDATGIMVSVFVNTNWANTTVYVYEDDVLQVSDLEGTLEYLKSTVADDYAVGIKIDGTADFIWANFTYTIDAEDNLSLTSLTFGTEGSDVTAFATTNWLNATLTLYEDDVEKDTGDEGTTLSYTKATAAGDYNIGLRIDGGADFIWANYTYSVAAAASLSVTVEDWSPLDSTILFVGTCNSPFSYYAYREGVYNDETGTAGSDGTSYSFDIARVTDAGEHTYQIYFNSSSLSGTRWFNFTDTVSSTYAWQYIRISDQSGRKIDYVLDIYVNGSLLYAEDFYGRTDVKYEIAVFDKFGDELSNITYDAPSSRQYNITLSLYSFKIKSWLDGKVLVYLYSSGGGSQSTWLAWDSEYEWFVFSEKSYQMKWETDANTTGVYGFGIHYFPALDSHCLTPDPVWYSPIGPVFVEIDAYGIAHLYDRIPDQAGGGSAFTQSDAEMVAQSLVDEFNPLLLGEGKGRLSLVIIGIFGALAYGQYFFTVKKISKPKPKPKPKPTGSDKDKDPKKPTTVSSHQGKNRVSTSQSRKKGSSHR